MATPTPKYGYARIIGRDKTYAYARVYSSGARLPQSVTWQEAHEITTIARRWLGLRPLAHERGTRDHLAAYLDALQRAETYYDATGDQCTARLQRQLVGLEGRTVRVLDTPTTERWRTFRVGLSLGWLPSHLECPPNERSGSLARPHYHRIEVVE